MNEETLKTKCACGKRLSFARSQAGRQGRCPRCGAVVTAGTRPTSPPRRRRPPDPRSNPSSGRATAQGQPLWAWGLIVLAGGALLAVVIATFPSSTPGDAGSGSSVAVEDGDSAILPSEAAPNPPEAEEREGDGSQLLSVPRALTAEEVARLSDGERRVYEQFIAQWSSKNVGIPRPMTGSELSWYVAMLRSEIRDAKPMPTPRVVPPSVPDKVRITATQETAGSADGLFSDHLLRDIRGLLDSMTPRSFCAKLEQSITASIDGVVFVGSWAKIVEPACRDAAVAALEKATLLASVGDDLDAGIPTEELLDAWLDLFRANFTTLVIEYRQRVFPTTETPEAEAPPPEEKRPVVGSAKEFAQHVLDVARAATPDDGSFLDGMAALKRAILDVRDSATLKPNPEWKAGVWIAVAERARLKFVGVNRLHQAVGKRATAGFVYDLWEDRFIVDATQAVWREARARAGGK